MAEQYEPFLVEGLPERSKRCATCNYHINNHTTPEKQYKCLALKNTTPHRCHSAIGSVCHGSLLVSKGPAAIQEEILKLM